MLDPLKSTVIVAAALTLTLLAPAAPAYADCIVVGAVQLDRHDLVDDPTGPVLIVKKSPGTISTISCGCGTVPF